MTIRYADRARRDLAQIGSYLNKRNARGSERVADAIRRSIDRLATFPFSGRLQEGPEAVRKLVVPSFGYLVYYRIQTGDEIMILTIRHHARKRVFVDR